jgi:hypothetical protein
MVARRHPPRHRPPHPPRPRARFIASTGPLSPYLGTVLDHWGQTERPPGLYFARVAHDDDCPALRGRECRCEPEVSIVEIAPAREDRGTA